MTNYSHSIKHRFFIAQALEANQCIEASKELSHYLSKVLRLRSGTNVILFNDSDDEFISRVEIDKRTVTLEIIEKITEQAQHRESPLPLYLAMSLIASDRFDWTVQKVTELGVVGIYPLLSKYVQLKLDQKRLEKRLEHWRKISISACEQSGRVKVPSIFAPSSLKQFLVAESGSHMIALCPEMSSKGSDYGSVKSISSLAQQGERVQSDRLICLIGPEGGWHEEEVQLFHQHDLSMVSLGPRILRSETAAVTSVALVQSLFGDLG